VSSYVGMKHVSPHDGGDELSYIPLSSVIIIQMSVAIGTTGIAELSKFLGNVSRKTGVNECVYIFRKSDVV
jgi:hypothetical protein